LWARVDTTLYYTTFVKIIRTPLTLDVHKDQILVAVAESGRGGAVEYLDQIANDPAAISKVCTRLAQPSTTLWRDATNAALVSKLGPT
jgi:hypothetical protein